MVKDGNPPLDENALDVSSFISRNIIHQLKIQTLTAFLGIALNKKFTNPSSDIINVIAGLGQVDTVFTEFVSSLDYIIRHGKSCMLKI